MSLDERQPGGVVTGAASVALLRLLDGDKMPEETLGCCWVENSAWMVLWSDGLRDGSGRLMRFRLRSFGDGSVEVGVECSTEMEGSISFIS
jgi:hypothetical protein